LAAGGGGARIGLKISLDGTGNLLAVGERYFDAGTGNNDDIRGRILVYNIAANGDITDYGVPINGENPEDETGSSVMISSDGSCLVFGSNGSNNSLNPGSASVYCWDTEAWVFRQKLDGESAADQYGSSVAISEFGTYVAIGGPKHDPDGRKDAGHVRVFAFSGSTYGQLGNDIDGEIGESDTTYYIGYIMHT
jgi:hypothetical protein